ncbi:MAG: dihydroorotate dehydrogenase [Mycoplasmatales bacterium]
MKTTICNIDFKNPIIPASGTFGNGYEFSQFYDINILGSISIKAVTIDKRYGNNLPRIAEVKSGMINAIGLQNPSAKYVVENELPKLKKIVDYKVIANIAGFSIEEYVECAMVMDKSDMVALLELNVSCPNVHSRGTHFGNDIEQLVELIKQVKKHVSKPVFIKLSPNVSDIVEVAIACEKAGADGLTMINTLIGMKIDINTRKPILNNKVGGLSGSCIMPVSIRMIYQVYEQVNIPIIGVGGISSAQDVVEMMMAGASLVQIGTANLMDPYACKKIIEELPNLVNNLGYKNINDLIGVAHE